MLEVMEQYVRPGHAIVDVGTGSGILSAAAAMLGAGRVFSCDIDEQAVLSAREHIDTPVFRGSADSVRSDVADLVLANISAIVIDALASDLNRIAKDDGSLLLAGFLSDNRPKRFVPEQEFERDGWLCWLCRPSRVMAQFGGASPLYHAERWW
jgi:ribosomal protein L11 methyltransferase